MIKLSRGILDQEPLAESRWQRHITPSSWGLLITFGSLLVRFKKNLYCKHVEIFTHYSTNLNRHTEDLVPMRVLETLPIKILRRSAGLPNEVDITLI